MPFPQVANRGPEIDPAGVSPGPGALRPVHLYLLHLLLSIYYFFFIVFVVTKRYLLCVPKPGSRMNLCRRKSQPPALPHSQHRETDGRYECTHSHPGGGEGSWGFVVCSNPAPLAVWLRASFPVCTMESWRLPWCQWSGEGEKQWVPSVRAEQVLRSCLLLTYLISRSLQLSFSECKRRVF